MTFRPLLIALLLALAVPGVASANSATQIIVKRDPGLTAAERADIRADAQVRLVESLPLPRTEVVAAKPGDAARRPTRPQTPTRTSSTPSATASCGASSDDEYFDDEWGLRLNMPTLTRGLGPQTGAGALWPSSTPADSDARGPRTVASCDGLRLRRRTIRTRRTRTGTARTSRARSPRRATTASASRESAPDARIFPIRVIDADGLGNVSDVIAGLQLRGGRAGPRGQREARRRRRVLDDRKGGDRRRIRTPVRGGGRQRRRDGWATTTTTRTTARVSRATYPAPNIVCVGASTTRDDTARDFSNYGETTVDVFAPATGSSPRSPATRTPEATARRWRPRTWRRWRLCS